jgi:alcohol dehydrogenase class IV
MQALRMVAACIVRAYRDPSDDEARAQMMLAPDYAEESIRRLRR